MAQAMTDRGRARASAAGPPAPRAGPRPTGPMLAAGYLVLIALPLALALTLRVAPAHPWEGLAAALGIAGLVGMVVQFVTSGRFEAVSGKLGIDRIMAFHKAAAWWLLLGLLLHPFLYVLPTWVADRALGVERFVTYLTAPHYRSGVIGWAALILLVLWAGLRDRLPPRYEVWRGAHVALALVAVIAGLHHALGTGRFSAAGPVWAVWLAAALIVAAVMATLYGVRFWRLQARPWRLAGITRLPGRMWELDIQPASGTPPMPFHAGQFVWMTVGNRRFPLFDHPFSIASSPTRPGLSLIIKEAGDFTATVGRIAPGTPIGIDGPYGEFTLEDHDDGPILLIAGGVGIAPVIGLIRDLVARRDPRPIRLIYAAGKPENFACLPEIAAAQERLDLQVLPISETEGPGWQGAVGRLTPERLRGLMQGLDPTRTVALMCGPGGMVTAVSDMLFDLGLPMAHVDYERFDYAGGASSRLDRRRSLQVLAIGAGVAGLVGAFAGAFALLAG